MAELKRNFSGAQGAKMNKDLDERIIPPGQYRDALNIEISTSESSNAGTAQNIRVILSVRLWRVGMTLTTIYQTRLPSWAL